MRFPNARKDPTFACRIPQCSGPQTLETTHDSLRILLTESAARLDHRTLKGDEHQTRRPAEISQVCPLPSPRGPSRAELCLVVTRLGPRSLPLPVSLPQSPTTAAGTTSQINDLHAILCQVLLPGEPGPTQLYRPRPDATGSHSHEEPDTDILSR